MPLPLVNCKTSRCQITSSCAARLTEPRSERATIARPRRPRPTTSERLPSSTSPEVPRARRTSSGRHGSERSAGTAPPDRHRGRRSTLPAAGATQAVDAEQHWMPAGRVPPAAGATQAVDA
eukprot:6942149-Prymnesium_polylepis.1